MKFTKSDIYWNGSAFKFEENQTDYPTSWNSSHVGHFYWTKTAEASYAAIYDDGTCTASDKFFADGSDDAHMLTVDGLGGLYVMTGDEMYYLFGYRTNASKLYKPDVSVTTGAGTFSRCVVIAPDNWDYTKNPLKTSYTAAEFAIAESAGLVCLPSAGGRVGSNVEEAGSYGVIWMATPRNESSAEDLFFTSDVDPDSCEPRKHGHSIRLVCTVSN